MEKAGELYLSRVNARLPINYSIELDICVAKNAIIVFKQKAIKLLTCIGEIKESE